MNSISVARVAKLSIYVSQSGPFPQQTIGHKSPMILRILLTTRFYLGNHPTLVNTKTTFTVSDCRGFVLLYIPLFILSYTVLLGDSGSGGFPTRHRVPAPGAPRCTLLPGSLRPTLATREVLLLINSSGTAHPHHPPHPTMENNKQT